APPLACVITNGAHATPGAPGSLRTVSRTGASPESRSPNRVAPPGRLKTDRPSAASRPDQPSQYAYVHRSATAPGGRIVSYRPAGSATWRRAQSRRRARSAPSAPRSTSRKSTLGTATYADRSNPADLALRLRLPVGWACRRRTPVEV